MNPPPHSFGKFNDITQRQAYRIGISDGSRLPAVVLVISLMGFGALCRESGLGLDFAIVQLVTMWALPGQIAFVELYASGGTVVAITLAVAMANARFMPMTATLMPLLRPGMRQPAWLYAMAHLVSFNAWIWVLRRCPELPPERRAAYYMGFVTVTASAGIVGAVAGYLLAGVVSEIVLLTLVFVNIVYFVLMMAAARGMAAILAVIAGGVAGPLLHMATSDWGLLLSGVIGGTLAFGVARAWRDHHV
ncbi:MAG: AzlC family ABC transporter permease [Proteobacteria bacterium]|nr:AzlC family ABC transporter permease [Pseudomonadota bacterium]MDA1357176.1 AzlC family ABC transporter permease [Pseudomonadota bacterium]